MVTDQDSQSVSFSGSAKSRNLAELAFNVLRGRGMFMSSNAPIRVPLDMLTTFLESQGAADISGISAALSDNSDIFTLDVEDGVTFVVTTREGRAPVIAPTSQTHTFKRRFLTPEPKPEVPLVPKREPARANPSWANFSISDYTDLEDEDEEVDDFEIEPAASFGAEDIELIIEPLDVVVTPEMAAPVTEISTPPAVEVEPEAPVVQEVPAAPVVEEVTAPVVTARPSGKVNFANATAEAIAAALHTRLAGDVHVAQFGDVWMAEDRVPRLSRGDLRKIKEYIEEQEQPLTDATLVQDILGVRANSVDFGLMEFAVNFRLSHEHRDFDFVGTSDQRFWSTTNLAPIGTTRRKPNEIGTDYRYLIDEVASLDIVNRSVTTIDHVVTFYEYNLGLLPYDADLQRLLPKPVTPDQRSAVLTFEIPQLYTTYLAELRYPTPNRGGFLLGLDDLYSESLVPGSIIAITATDNDGHYKVEFLASKDRSERLLELDDRRAPRYLFRPTTFSSEVADEWLISEDRFPNLGSEKPLDDKIRRRPDAVLEATFTRVGIDDGEGGLLSSFADLFAAVNVERPFSAALLQTTLDQHPLISGEGDTFTYVPGA